MNTPVLELSSHIQSKDGRTVLIICACDETVLQVILDTFRDIGENNLQPSQTHNVMWQSVNIKDAEG